MERIIKVVHSVFFILFFIIEFIFLLIHKIWGLVKLAILFPWIEAYWISIWNKYSVSQEYNKIREKYGRKEAEKNYYKLIITSINNKYKKQVNSDKLLLLKILFIPFSIKIFK